MWLPVPFSPHQHSQTEIPQSLSSFSWLPVVLTVRCWIMDPGSHPDSATLPPQAHRFSPLSTSASLMTSLEEQSLVRCDPPRQVSLPWPLCPSGPCGFPDGTARAAWSTARGKEQPRSCHEIRNCSLSILFPSVPWGISIFAFSLD